MSIFHSKYVKDFNYKKGICNSEHQKLSYRVFTYLLTVCQLQEIKVVLQIQMSRKKRLKSDGDSIVILKIRIMRVYS